MKLSRGAVPALGAAMPLFSGLAALSQASAARNDAGTGSDERADTRWSSADGSSAAASSNTAGGVNSSQRQSGGRGNAEQATAQTQQVKAAQLRAELKSLQAEKAALELRLQSGPPADAASALYVPEPVPLDQIATGAPMQASRASSGAGTAMPGAPDLRADSSPEPPASGGGGGGGGEAPRDAALELADGGRAGSDASSEYVPPAGYPFPASENDSDVSVSDGSVSDASVSAGADGAAGNLSSAESLGQSCAGAEAAYTSSAPKDDPKFTSGAKVNARPYIAIGCLHSLKTSSKNTSRSDTQSEDGLWQIPEHEVL